MSILSKIFGDANQKIIDELQKKVDEINNLEDKFKGFSAQDFKNKTQEFKKKLAGKNFDEQQKILNEILPQAFALVRQAARKTLDQRHYDVQLIAGIVLNQGNVAEMRTGEGKTLASTTAVYLNALTGYGAHVITVNDYLARRDMAWMGQVYNLLGLSVGCLNHESAFLYSNEASGEGNKVISNKVIKGNANDANNLDKPDKERDEIGSFHVVDEFLKPVERKQAYSADITYGTNNEFGFDYLRDNMVQNLEQKVQRDLHYAIIDEVDSILIDEARTPLIISAPDTEPTEKYKQFAQLVVRLKENDDYNIDEKMKAATLTEEGIKKMENWLNVENIYTERGIREVHHIEQALKAQVLFKKDKDYVVKDGEVIIVDEFTGRLMPGRRYSEGLHQAIEAKENVEVKQESITMATITFQNYFRMYQKLSGMTGTAATEAEELSKIYSLDVIVVPTNKPMIRQDKTDVILKTQQEKYQAIVNEIKTRNKLGQPVLVGTISIENNEYLSGMLSREGVEHKLLNAKHHEEEGEIIAQAGRKGAVTIATNMAGRGVDIVLGGNPVDKNEQQEVLKLGGLHVLGTERHESRRIDNQLRGRAGRQGDPGSTHFFVSMEDDLMRIFGGERMKTIMQSLGVPDGMPIENKIISSSIEKAQQKVEGHNFDIRKHLVDYDDVINKHREVIYKKRNEILNLPAETQKVEGLMMSKNIIFKYIREEISNVVKFHTKSPSESEWNLEEIYETMNSIFPVPLEVRVNIEEIKDKTQDTINNKQGIENIKNSTPKTSTCKQITAKSSKEFNAEKYEIKSDDKSVSGRLINYLFNLSVQEYTNLETRINNDENLKNQIKDKQDPMRIIEKMILLRGIDMLWVEHIDAMDHMRTGIGLQGYGQKDPLVEYKKEAYRMFDELLANIRKQVVYTIYKVGVAPPKPQEKRDVSFSGPSKSGATSSTISKKSGKIKKDGKKVGRNDPCPCGSGKKYKKCCAA